MPTKTNISVIDDSSDIIEVVKLIFKGQNSYRFKYFLSGKDFVNSLSDAQFLDLVILDVHLEPYFDAIQAVELVNETYPMAYVIILSGDKDPKKLIQFIKLGVFDFIEKGAIDFVSELRDAVRRAHRKITIRKGILDNGLE